MLEKIDLCIFYGTKKPLSSEYYLRDNESFKIKKIDKIIFIFIIIFLLNIHLRLK
jgi:hypothetical protein